MSRRTYSAINRRVNRHADEIAENNKRVTFFHTRTTPLERSAMWAMPIVHLCGSTQVRGGRS
jgi:hypothetical protein